MNKERIWEKADIIRGLLKIKVPIKYDKLDEVVTSLGGKLKEAEECDGLLGDAMIISALGEDEEGFEIIYKKGLSEKKLVYVVCHELGHLFLHMLKADGTIKKVSYNNGCHTSEQEYEADEFAYSFLMPKEDFMLYSIDKLEQNKEDYAQDIVDIAEHFNVTTQFVLLRGNDLKLWKMKN